VDLHSRGRLKEVIVRSGERHLPALSSKRSCQLGGVVGDATAPALLDHEDPPGEGSLGCRDLGSLGAHGDEGN
jgi:hypothetical protein